MENTVQYLRQSILVMQVLTPHHSLHKKFFTCEIALIFALILLYVKSFFYKTFWLLFGLYFSNFLPIFYESLWKFSQHCCYSLKLNMSEPSVFEKKLCFLAKLLLILHNYQYKSIYDTIFQERSSCSIIYPKASRSVLSSLLILLPLLRVISSTESWFPTLGQVIKKLLNWEG